LGKVSGVSHLPTVVSLPPHLTTSDILVAFIVVLIGFLSMDQRGCKMPLRQQQATRQRPYGSDSGLRLLIYTWW